MRSFHNLLGPKSKYDRRIPYTYEARVDALAGQGGAALHEYYFSDTICGLLEMMNTLSIGPERAEVFGVFRGELERFDNGALTNGNGSWLFRPQLCRCLEAKYQASGDRRYAGHAQEGHCSFEDRDRRGLGPY